MLSIKSTAGDGATALEASFFVENEMREFFRFAEANGRALLVNVLMPASVDKHHAKDQADSLAALQRRANLLFLDFRHRVKVGVAGLQNLDFSAALRFRKLTPAEETELRQ